MASAASSWPEIVTAIVAVVALIVSVISLYFSWQALRLENRREMRRQPVLIPLLLNGYVRVDHVGGARVYAFFISVSNPADTDNTVAELDLRVTYLTRERVQMTVKIGADETLAAEFPQGTPNVFSIPKRISAHDTVSGWCYFRGDAAVFNGVRIEGYSIVLTDSHRAASSVEPILVQEFAGQDAIFPS